MRIRPGTFLTSDSHFGHFAMTSFQNRNVGFEEELIAAWNAVVTNKDQVLHLGDLVMSHDKEKALGWLRRLNGRKFLILGNHDGRTDSWYKEAGFTVIPDAHESFHDKYDRWTHYLFTHEPVAVPAPNWFNIHGHNHGNLHRGATPDDRRHYDVGVDAQGYAPKRLSEIMALLAARPKEQEVIAELPFDEIPQYIQIFSEPIRRSDTGPFDASKFLE